MNRHMLGQEALAAEGLATNSAGVGGGAGAGLGKGKVKEILGLNNRVFTDLTSFLVVF